jgi:hypothetical protein
MIWYFFATCGVNAAACGVAVAWKHIHGALRKLKFEKSQQPCGFWTIFA